MVKTGFVNEKRLPLLVEPEEGDHAAGTGVEVLLRLCLERRDFLHDKLLEYGALLFRGFSVFTAADVGRVVRYFSDREPLDYVGGVSPRNKLGHGVYTSTEYPQHYTLSLHNEMSYTYRWPEYLFFCCVTAPEQGGETPLGDSRALLRSLDKEMVRRFKERGVRYERNLEGVAESNLSWQAAFETDDRSIVEDYCRQGGVAFRWRDDGELWLSEVRQATSTHTRTGEEVWFNQADGFHPSAMGQEMYAALMKTMTEESLRLNCFYGDGTPLDVSALDHIRDVMQREMALFQWRDGDLLILENMLTAHGRMPFTGPRKILLAMA